VADHAESQTLDSSDSSFLPNLEPE